MFAPGEFLPGLGLPAVRARLANPAYRSLARAVFSDRLRTSGVKAGTFAPACLVFALV